MYSFVALHSVFQNVDVVMKVFFVFPAVKKDVKDETDDRMQQFKKKAKELRILDSKTAQNLCKYTVMFCIDSSFNIISSLSTLFC